MNKFEVLGIFGSIAVMAVALALITTRTNEAILSTTEPDPASQTGSVVAATEEAPLGATLHESTEQTGQLQDIIIDDIKIGVGDGAELGDTLEVHYIGSTQDGVQFDNSYERGSSFSFTLGDNKVIEGWERGLLGMKAGGERVLVIPAKYAYGNRQVGPIAANSTLVFAVSLLAIHK